VQRGIVIYILNSNKRAKVLAISDRSLNLNIVKVTYYRCIHLGSIL